MDPTSLIPIPDTIPAPSWLFITLDLLLFTLHILLVNIILGGSMIIAWKRLFSKNDSLSESNHGVLASKIPTTFALAVNLGVAPLLFMQVIYGNLFYTSSILMAIYWILVIPFLILAYYGAYIHIKKYDLAAGLSKFAIIITSVLLLLIGFIYVNNMTLMIQPDKWTAYFDSRGGTILNLSDPTLLPRYLHFVVASVAVAGLFMALVWTIREKKGHEDATTKIQSSLKIFGIATIVQIVIGLWFLVAIPSDFILQFMGGNILFSIVLLIGFLAGLGAIATAFKGNFRSTLIMLIVTILAMVITRHNLRTLYLQNIFDPANLQLTPQYDVMILFLVVLGIGLFAVWYMVKQTDLIKERRAG